MSGKDRRQEGTGLAPNQIHLAPLMSVFFPPLLPSRMPYSIGAPPPAPTWPPSGPNLTMHPYISWYQASSLEFIP